MHTEERTAAKEVPLSSAEQALHDELVSLMHQESLAKAHNDDQRIAFEEEKRRISIAKGKEHVNSTFTLSTANTPPQSAGNTPTDTDDDMPKDGVFFTNSFDAENTDNEDEGVTDYINMDPTIDVTSTPTLRIHKIHPQSQIIGKSTAGVQTRRKLKESTSVHHQALLSFIYKQNRTNHKDQQTCLFACFLSQEEPKKVSQALADESWVEAMQEELLQFKLQENITAKHSIQLKLIYLVEKLKRGEDVDVNSYRSMIGWSHVPHSQPIMGIYGIPKELSFSLRSFSDSDYDGGTSMIEDQRQEVSVSWKKTGLLAMQETNNCGYLLYRSRICSSCKLLCSVMGAIRDKIASALVGGFFRSIVFGNKKFRGSDRPQDFIPSVSLPSKVFTFMRKHSTKFSCRITPLTPSMLEVVTALAAEEEHSTSPHSRAASSARDAQGSPTQSAAHSQRTASVQGTASFHGTANSQRTAEIQGTASFHGTANSQRTAEIQGTADFQGTAEPHDAASIPKSPNDYTPTDAFQTSGGDEGLLDIYALNREVRRLKKQTLAQAKLIRKLKAKLKNLSQVVAPVIKHHAFWVENQNLKKQKRRRKKHKKKVSSVKLGRNKDEGTLSEEHYVQEEDTADPFFDDFVDKDAAITPDLERKSDETEEVNIEEKEASNVRSGDTVMNWICGQLKGTTKSCEVRVSIYRPKSDKEILVEEPKKKKLTLQQIRALETTMLRRLLEKFKLNEMQEGRMKRDPSKTLFQWIQRRKRVDVEGKRSKSIYGKGKLQYLKIQPSKKPKLRIRNNMELQVIDSPDGEYLIIHRENNHFRAFDTLWEILHVLDRQDLYHLYRVVEDYYEHIPPTGLGLMLLGDLSLFGRRLLESSGDDLWKIRMHGNS
ncbi:hypothetical protein Tco_0830260 [Tanacetum coccineum]